MPTRVAIASRIKQARGNAELSRSALAARIGTTERTIGNYENGNHRVPLEVACALAEALDVTVEWLAFGTDTAPRIERRAGERRKEERRAGRRLRATPAVVRLLTAVVCLQSVSITLELIKHW